MPQLLSQTVLQEDPFWPIQVVKPFKLRYLIEASSFGMDFALSGAG
jgi:hypothetical protein